MFKSLILPELLACHSDKSEFTVFKVFDYSKTSVPVSQPANYLFESFKVYSLFSYQGSVLCISATAYSF